MLSDPTVQWLLIYLSFAVVAGGIGLASRDMVSVFLGFFAIPLVFASMEALEFLTQVTGLGAWEVSGWIAVIIFTGLLYTPLAFKLVQRYKHARPN